ncbi:hypothetical protein F4776DRAFT_89905 [Hypoxylon sp. NC0597]|nr:hypothetical protein F4776DRAFT_89905 [Hypoxylon sp. NC0597]
MHNLIDLIEKKAQGGSGKLQKDEFYVYLYIFGLLSAEFLKGSQSRSVKSTLSSSMSTETQHQSTGTKPRDLRHWHDRPPIVCVTMKIPQQSLSMLYSMDPSNQNSAQVRCSIGSKENRSADEFSCHPRLSARVWGQLGDWRSL